MKVVLPILRGRGGEGLSGVRGFQGMSRMVPTARLPKSDRSHAMPETSTFSSTTCVSTSSLTFPSWVTSHYFPNNTFLLPPSRLTPLGIGIQTLCMVASCQRGRTRVTAAHTDPTPSGAAHMTVQLAPSVQASRRVRTGQSLRQLAPTFVARQARNDEKREAEMWWTDDCNHRPWCLGVAPALRQKGSLTKPLCGGDRLCVHGLVAGTQ